MLLLGTNFATGVGGSFLLHSGVVGAAFRVQFLVLSGTISAVVLGQFMLLSGTVFADVMGHFPATIFMQFWVHFWCSFGYFPVQILWRWGWGLFSSTLWCSFTTFLVQSLLLYGTDFATGVSTGRFHYRSAFALACAITGLTATFAAYAPLPPSSSGSLSLHRPCSVYCNGPSPFWTLCIHQGLGLRN